MRPTHTVLLVEDNLADIKITQRALRSLATPVELIALRDGQEALDYLFRQGCFATDPTWRCPDLVLLDLNLPRIGGLEVLARARAHSAWRTLPVIVLTTSRRQEDVLAVYAAGANTYIEKPQEFARFVQVLEAVLHYWLEMALLPSTPRL